MSTLDSLVDDPAALAARFESLDAQWIAGRSYWHHNGFAKFVLSVAPSVSVRLHVWPTGLDEADDSNPHGHRWNFASAVLCGSGIVQRLYTEDLLGTRYTRHRYVGKVGVRSLTPDGNARLVPSDSTLVRSGQNYSVDTSYVHTVEPVDTSFTATLVVQGAVCRESTVVYCRPGRKVDGIDRPITADETRRLLGQVRASIDTTQGSVR